MPPRVEAAQQGGQQQQGGGGIVQQLMRYGMMYFMFKNIFGFGGNKQQSTNREDQLWPKYERGEVFDVAIYMHESSHFPSQHHGNTDYLIWEERGLPLAGQGIDLQKQITYRASEAVQHNGTLFMHVFFTRPGASPNPNSPDFKQGEFFHKVHPLVRYLPERKAEEGVSLLSKEGKEKLAADKEKQQQEGEGAAKEEEPPRRIVSYLKPNVTIEMVDIFNKFPQNQVPPHIQPHLDVDPFAKEYSPVVHFNDFWLMREHLVPMNETTTEVPMTVFLRTMAGWKWQLYLQVGQSFVMQQQMGMAKEGEEDDLKRVLLEGNPYFLALTFAVSMLHSVFDVFAFKNDIGFWKNKENLTGLSVRTIGINCFCQAVIFLYLLDNETSFVVLASSFVGTLIEFWKVTKAMDVSITWRGSIPIPTFRDKSSYSKTETAQHDAQAMQYLSWVLYPLLGGYAIYTLVYDKHKSWYSWVLSTMVGAVYAFGFITMCPQLYINYKLKSVAHLPWRQMSYKFLNTIIDDLFAFVIKMPLLHRLAVFRDDIVFVIFIYQRWIYRVDKTRVNEFGYTEAPPPPGVAAAAEGQLLEGEEAAAGGARRRRGAGQQQQQVEEEDGSEGAANGVDGEITAADGSSADAAASAAPEKKKDK